MRGVRHTPGSMANGVTGREGGTGTREAGDTMATGDGAGSSTEREDMMAIPEKDGGTTIIPGRGEASDVGEIERYFQ